MHETSYVPGDALAKGRSHRRTRRNWIQGVVHDPRGVLMGGVAGHAGLFSTAEDLAVYAQMMLQGGRYGESGS